MPERENISGSPETEIVFSSNQEGPFAFKREGDKWQLSVNRNYFIAKGFTPDEINGATVLEQTVLSGQTKATSVSEVEGLKRWQNLSSQDKQASAFKTAFDHLAALASLERQDPDRAKLARRYLEKFASRPPSDSYADQLFNVVLRSELGKEPGPTDEVVQRVWGNLQRQENLEERLVSPVEALTSPDLSPGAKASWFEARFSPRYEFLRHQDQLRRQQEVEETVEETEQTPVKETPPPTPPPANDEYEQHRGREEKGEGQPTFSITPGFTGYWEQESYDIIDESSGRLKKTNTQRNKIAVSAPSTQIVESSKRTISGQSGTELFSLPLAPGFQLTAQGYEVSKTNGASVFADPEGHIFIKYSANQPINIEIALGLQPTPSELVSHDVNVSLQVPTEIEEQLQKIMNQPTSALDKVARWQEFVHDFFRYPQDDQVASMYSQIDHSSSRLEAMAENKLLDCYLAREFFIAGLKRLHLDDLEWRGVNGYYVASREKDGSSQLHSGNAHAWVKIRTAGEKTWTIFDPTPPGDPIHEGEGSLDEFGDASSGSISQEDMEALEGQAQAREEKERKTHETQDHYLMQFSQQAGIPPEEAREILLVLKQVDKLKDGQGREILARLKEQFDRIIESYTLEKQEMSGLVEMSRGQDLEEPVAATLDLRAGSLDPLGFSRRRITEEKQEIYGGLDLEIVADGSGSMNDPLGGRAKYLVQRDMSYLLHRALHRFSQEAQNRKLRLITPLKIRSSQYLFRGNKIEPVKPLSEEFTPSQMASLWKKSAENIGGGTPAHLGLQAVLDRIPPEEVKLLQEKKLLKVVALISDGRYDDPSRVEVLIRKLQDMNVVVTEFPITDSQSLDNLPQNVADKVIESAKTLMPEKVRK